MLYNNDKYRTIKFRIIREGVLRVKPIRFFVINNKTKVMHAYGCCQQTKSRSVPIRLFDTQMELEEYAGRRLVICKDCDRRLKELK